MVKRYRIYQMTPTAEHIDYAAEKYRFHRATSHHLLVYTNKRKPVGSTLIRDPRALPAPDRGWVAACNIIIADEALHNDPGAQAGILNFLADLEKELEKEQVQLKEA